MSHLRPGAAPYPTATGAARSGSLRERAGRRVTPRFGTTLAATGVVLVVIGALIISGHSLVTNSAFGGFGGRQVNRAPGIVTCLVLVGLGYLLVARARSGPLGSAGVSATVLAVPALVFFIAYDANSADPVPVTAILVVSTFAWTIAYLAGPSRGHGAYLGGAALALWLLILQQVQDLAAVPGSLISVQVVVDGSSGAGGSGVHRTGLGVASLLIGMCYLLGVRVLDRRGLHGSGTPFALVGVLALATGYALLAEDLGQAGTGLLLLIVGVLVTLLGAVGERRFSTWTGGLGVLYGVGLLIDDAVDGATPTGVVLIVVGVALVFAAYAVARAWREPDETVPGPSRFAVDTGTSGAPGAGWPPPGSAQPGWPPPTSPQPGWQPPQPPPHGDPYHPPS